MNAVSENPSVPTMLSYFDCGVWTVTLVITVVGGACVTRYVTRRRGRLTPGPEGYPFIGVLMQLGDFSAIHKKLTAYGRKYGGRIFQFKVLGQKTLVLRSASIVERALAATEMSNRKSPFFQRFIFNDKSFAFANYSEHVPELRHVFFVAVYSAWQTDGLTTSAISRTLSRHTHYTAARGGDSLNPDPWIRDMMADLYTQLVSSHGLVLL